MVQITRRRTGPTVNQAVQEGMTATPEQFGAGLGRGIQRFTGGLAEAGMRMQRAADQARIQELGNEAYNLDQDFRAQMESAKGYDAAEKQASLSEEFDKRLSDIESNMSGSQRKMWGVKGDRIRSDYQRWSTEHAAIESTKAHRATLDELMVINDKYFAAAYREGDGDVVQQRLNDFDQALVNAREMGDITPQEYNQMSAQARSNAAQMHLNELMTNGTTDQVKEFLKGDQAKDLPTGMSQKAWGQVDRYEQNQQAQFEADKAVVEAERKGMTLSEVQADLETRHTPEELAKIMPRVEARFKQLDELKKAEFQVGMDRNKEFFELWEINGQPPQDANKYAASITDPNVLRNFTLEYKRKVTEDANELTPARERAFGIIEDNIQSFEDQTSLMLAMDQADLTQDQRVEMESIFRNRDRSEYAGGKEVAGFYFGATNNKWSDLSAGEQNSLKRAFNDWIMEDGKPKTLQQKEAWWTENTFATDDVEEVIGRATGTVQPDYEEVANAIPDQERTNIALQLQNLPTPVEPSDENIGQFWMARVRESQAKIYAPQEVFTGEAYPSTAQATMEYQDDAPLVRGLAQIDDDAYQLAMGRIENKDLTATTQARSIIIQSNTNNPDIRTSVADSWNTMPLLRLNVDSTGGSRTIGIEGSLTGVNRDLSRAGQNAGVSWDVISELSGRFSEGLAFRNSDIYNQLLIEGGDIEAEVIVMGLDHMAEYKRQNPLYDPGEAQSLNRMDQPQFGIPVEALGKERADSVFATPSQVNLEFLR